MDGFLTNAQGHMVPTDKVKPADLLRDELVKKLIADAKCEQAGLQHFKTEATNQVNDFVDLIAAEHGVELGGKKGNISLLSYCGCMKVNIQVSEHITFDESLKAAKAIIDDLIQEWSDGANVNLKVVVMDAFEVDKEGKISVSRLLGLRRLAIEEAEWKKASEYCTIFQILHKVLDIL